MEYLTELKNLDYIKLIKTIREIKEKYPDIKVNRIGKSSMGKDIFALTVANGAYTDEVIFAAAFHGSEHITTNISLLFIEELCASLKEKAPLCDMNLKRALRARAVTVIPRVNPDGADISIIGAAACGQNEEFIRKISGNKFTLFNANARGVDLNHNFNADWENLHRLERKAGIYGPAPTRYGGAFPESEPETKAITKYCRERNIISAFALHTQGEVIYWNFGKNTPARSQKMAEIMATVSGYALDVPVALATGGGFKDWFTEEFRRPAFTLEMGHGKNPLPIEDAQTIYEKAKEMLVLAAVM